MNNYYYSNIPYRYGIKFFSPKPSKYEISYNHPTPESGILKKTPQCNTKPTEAVTAAAFKNHHISLPVPNFPFLGFLLIHLFVNTKTPLSPSPSYLFLCFLALALILRVAFFPVKMIWNNSYLEMNVKKIKQTRIWWCNLK